MGEHLAHGAGAWIFLFSLAGAVCMEIIVVCRMFILKNEQLSHSLYRNYALIQVTNLLFFVSFSFFLSFLTLDCLLLTQPCFSTLSYQLRLHYYFFFSFIFSLSSIFLAFASLVSPWLITTTTICTLVSRSIELRVMNPRPDPGFVPLRRAPVRSRPQRLASRSPRRPCPQPLSQWSPR